MVSQLPNIVAAGHPPRRSNRNKDAPHPQETRGHSPLTPFTQDRSLSESRFQEGV